MLAPDCTWHGCPEQDVSAQKPIMTSFLKCLSLSKAPFLPHARPRSATRPIEIARMQA
jgi:hypothetical protein